MSSVSDKSSIYRSYPKLACGSIYYYIIKTRKHIQDNILVRYERLKLRHTLCKLKERA